MTTPHSTVNVFIPSPIIDIARQNGGEVRPAVVATQMWDGQVQISMEQFTNGDSIVDGQIFIRMSQEEAAVLAEGIVRLLRAPAAA